MRGAGLDEFGGKVHMLELAAPASPAPDEVVILVHAAGVGNWDEFARVGDWEVGRRPPLALGGDVRGLAPGDEVLTHPVPLRHQGAWAPWLLAPAALVARKPAVVGWEQAAAFSVAADQALTAAAPVPASEWVLVPGASVAGDADLTRWVGRAAEFVSSMPAKASK